MFYPMQLRAAALVIAMAFAPLAHAAWTLASADAPVTVLRAVTLGTASAGDALRDGDLLDSGEGVVHVQDERGTLVALGPHTRAMLAGDAHIALLHGWLKLAASACAAQPCAKPRVDTERGSLDVDPNAATIIAAQDNAQTVDMFSETGSQTFASKPPTGIANGHFASIDAQARLQLSPRPSQPFITAMPVAFRDALQPVAIMKPAHVSAPPPTRAVNYDDIAPWLESRLPERKTFPSRFRARLTDSAFRRDIDTHLKTLPDWRALLHPTSRPAVGRPHYF